MAEICRERRSLRRHYRVRTNYSSKLDLEASPSVQFSISIADLVNCRPRQVPRRGLVDLGRALRPSNLQRGLRLPDPEQDLSSFNPERSLKPFSSERLLMPSDQEPSLRFFNGVQSRRMPNNQHNTQIRH